MKKSPKFPNNQAFSLFCTFLKRNDAYSSFMRNLSELRSFPYFKSFEDCTPDCYLLFAFHWGSTPEGGKYWDLLNDKWKLVLNLFNF